MSGERDRDGEPASSGEPDGWTESDIDAAFAEIIAQYGRTAPQIGPWPVAEDLDGQPPDAERPTREGRSASGGPAPERSGRPGPASRGTPPAPTDLPPTDLPPTDLPPTDLPAADLPAADLPPSHLPAADGPDPDRRDPARPRLDRPTLDRSGLDRPTPDRPVVDPNGAEDTDDEEQFVPPEPLPMARGDFVTSLAWVCVLGGPLVLIVAALAWRTIPGEVILAAVVAFIGGFVTLVARLPGERPDDPDDGAVV